VGRTAHCARAGGGEAGGVLAALLLIGSLGPLLAMLVALFAAAWLRERRLPAAENRR
jgi:hypothetical protein